MGLQVELLFILVVFCGEVAVYALIVLFALRKAPRGFRFPAFSSVSECGCCMTVQRTGRSFLTHGYSLFKETYSVQATAVNLSDTIAEVAVDRKTKPVIFFLNVAQLRTPGDAYKRLRSDLPSGNSRPMQMDELGAQH